MVGQSNIVFGAASKGIIKRDQQNNAVVYKTYYAAANPFQQMDPNDLEKYKKEVAQKQMKEQGITFYFLIRRRRILGKKLVYIENFIKNIKKTLRGSIKFCLRSYH